jgi:hypothetical protein
MQLVNFNNKSNNCKIKEFKFKNKEIKKLGGYRDKENN